MKNTIELSEEEVKAALTLYINTLGYVVDTSTYEYIDTDEGIVVLVEEEVFSSAGKYSYTF